MLDTRPGATLLFRHSTANTTANTHPSLRVHAHVRVSQLVAPKGLHGCDNFTRELIKKREVGGVNKSSAAAEKERQRESKRVSR